MNNYDLYQEIGRFTTEVFHGATSSDHIRKMIQEGHEVIDDPTDITEYADCAITLFAAAYKQNFTFSDLMEAVERKMEVNKNRTWVKLPDGTYQHEEKEHVDYCQCEASIIDRTKVGFYCKSCGCKIKMNF